MEILLQSFDSFDEMVEFDPRSHQLNRWSKRDNPQRPFRPIQGHISKVDNHSLIFYRGIRGVLHLSIDGHDFDINEDLHIQWDRNDLCRLTLLDRVKVVFTLDYKVTKVNPPLCEDITPFVDEEDFDFGLFIYNVLKDKDRRERIYRNQ